MDLRLMPTVFLRNLSLLWNPLESIRLSLNVRCTMDVKIRRHAQQSKKKKEEDWQAFESGKRK